MVVEVVGSVLWWCYGGRGGGISAMVVPWW